MLVGRATLDTTNPIKAYTVVLLLAIYSHRAPKRLGLIAN
jgi:hypothetical protein